MRMLRNAPGVKIAESAVREQEPKVERGAIAWEPRPNSAQELVVKSEASEILMGGPAGIGKSDALLGMAFTLHTNAIIFRREYPQLKGLIRRGNEILGSREYYNKTEKIWDLGDRTVELGACQYEEDVDKFQGQPHDLIGFDELTHFTQKQYTFLSGWNRTAKEGQRCRVVCTSNPPTSEEGRWVIDRWAPWLDKGYERRTGRKAAMPGEIRWVVCPEGGEEMEVDGGEPFEFAHPDGRKERLEPRSRTFITGTMIEDLRKTGYTQTLQALPEPLRSILLKGIWNVDLPDDAFQVIPTAWIDAAMERWNPFPTALRQTHLGVDVARGGKDKTVICSRWENWVDKLVEYDGRDTPDGKATAREIRKEIKNPGVKVGIDVIGVGSSAFDFCNEMGMETVPCVGSGSAKEGTEPKTDRSGLMTFQNLRAYNYWRLRELLDPSNKTLVALPPDDKLREELRVMRWAERGRQVAVTSKEEIKKTLGRSPDRADALAYAFWEGGEPSAEWMLSL